MANTDPRCAHGYWHSCGICNTPNGDMSMFYWGRASVLEQHGDDHFFAAQQLAEKQNKLSELQAIIDDFAEGKITKDEFLKKLGYKKDALS